MTINITLAMPPKVQKCKKCNRVLSKNVMKGVNQGGKRKKTNRIKNNKRKQNIHKSVSFICRNYPIKYIFSTHYIIYDTDIQSYNSYTSKQRISCLSSSFGRRYLNSKYNSVSEFDMVVPLRKVAPRSLPIRSWIVRIA